MNEKQHIPEEQFTSFAEGNMKDEDLMHFLEHLGSCNYCANHLDAVMSGEIITAPRDMKENILTAVKRPEVQLAMKARQTSKQMQLFFYSLKVGTATACALLLLFLTMNYSSILTTPNFQEAPWSKNNDFSLTDTLRDNVDKLSDNMLDFSNSIIKMEVFNHDKKER